MSTPLLEVSVSSHWQEIDRQRDLENARLWRVVQIAVMSLALAMLLIRPLPVPARIYTGLRMVGLTGLFGGVFAWFVRSSARSNPHLGAFTVASAVLAPCAILTALLTSPWAGGVIRARTTGFGGVAIAALIPLSTGSLLLLTRRWFPREAWQLCLNRGKWVRGGVVGAAAGLAIGVHFLIIVRLFPGSAGKPGARLGLQRDVPVVHLGGNRPMTMRNGTGIRALFRGARQAQPDLLLPTLVLTALTTAALYIAVHSDAPDAQVIRYLCLILVCLAAYRRNGLGRGLLAAAFFSSIFAAQLAAEWRRNGLTSTAGARSTPSAHGVTARGTGPTVRRGHGYPVGLHPLPEREGGSEPWPAPLHPHRVGRGIPLRGPDGALTTDGALGDLESWLQTDLQVCPVSFSHGERPLSCE